MRQQDCAQLQIVVPLLGGGKGILAQNETLRLGCGAGQGCEQMIAELGLKTGYDLPLSIVVNRKAAQFFALNAQVQRQATLSYDRKELREVGLVCAL